MKIFFRIAIIVLGIFQTQMLSAERKLLYGSDLKVIAEQYLADEGISNKVLVSDKRAFFPCAAQIYISPKNENNWNTLNVSCGSPASWSVALRTQESLVASGGEAAPEIPDSVKIVFTSRNIPKGTVIQQDDLMMKWASSRSSRGAYITIENIVGHKAKRNMARDTVVKSQHILPNNAVNKNDTILIVSSSSGLSITTYGEALSNGKLGDMILVKNLSSNKKFKAVVTAEKKVTPITNIN
ncbi:MAG: flagellar basal body P-ring formation chaperone FlgA [Planktomarina sp.]|nr:flagellar basal body P-ring formation chaperone FlgA [Planktomarina sp.]